MKIAIAATDNNDRSPVDGHFGRCNWFCIVDKETGKVEYIVNSARDNRHDAGSACAEFLLQLNIDIVVAGCFGSKVAQLFRSKRVQMIVPDKMFFISDIIKKL